ncbi:MAG: hypothetical protein AABY42_01040 [Nitrospirota bacterium]
MTRRLGAIILFLYFSCTFAAFSLYAQEPSTNNSQGAYTSGNAQPAADDKNNTKSSQAPDSGTTVEEYSGYPKTFIIPKGVCEMNTPVMVITNDPAAKK